MEDAQAQVAATLDVDPFWAEEVGRCADDPARLIHEWGQIEERGDPGILAVNVLGGDEPGLVGSVRFRLWDSQRKALAVLHESRRVVILKARQLGLTWLVLAYALWMCLFRPSRLVVWYSDTLDNATDAIERAKYLYWHLPDGLRNELPKPVGEARGEFRFENGSILRARAATESAGVSFTASLIVLDEMSRMKRARSLLAAAQPTIEAGGKLICLSTALGTGNAFHSLWENAWTRHLRGERLPGDFYPIFLPWWSRPGRDHAWYEAQLRTAEDPARVPENYPATPEEAFLATGDLRFPPSWIATQRTTERPHGLPVEKWPARLRNLDLTVWGLNGSRSDRRLDLYRPPMPNRRIVLAADTAVGLERGDYDAAVALDLDSREEVARIRGKWEADQYADLLCEVAVSIGATLVIERNNESGGAVLMAVAQRAKRYAEYEARGHHADAARFAVPAVGRGLDGRPGWVTNAATRPQMMALLARGLRDAFQSYGPHAITLHSPDLIAELGALRRNEKGRPEAPKGKHDDCVLALCVALGFAHLKPKPGRAAAGGESPAGNWRRLGA